MLAAQARGHEIWFCEPRHLSLEHADAVARAWPVTVRRVAGRSLPARARRRTVPLESCDVVLMRKDPPFDLDYYFATLMLERARGKTLLINDPRGLREHNEKLAVLEFPDLCPPTVVTRETTRLRSFLAEQGGEMVVKPLDASGGFGVFHVRQGDPEHGRHPRAGDRPRPPLDDGAEVPARGAPGRQAHPAGRRRALCAVLRVPAPDDARGNLHVGAKPDGDQAGRARRARSSRALGPRLREHGQFFVGLDVIGGWLTEINVTSPTGILEANTLYDDAYEMKVLERLEQKIRSSAS